MTQFIKLTNILFNTNDVHKILITPNKYFIYIMSKQIDGFSIGGFGFGFGTIGSYTKEIEICESKHPTDYKIMSDWISKH